ncbi:MAG TPA: hypothetical protein VHE61_22325 [Opitutaceae bacterium]|nr:hypothetical protein [Opitutaceae bacterium]
MGFLDRFSGKKPAPATNPAAGTDAVSSDPAAGGDAALLNPSPAAAGPSVRNRLISARERLEAKDLPGALAIYEEILATAGDRADVLVTISGDLGAQGHVTEIIELVAPRYDVERHGPATGINLVQAYLAVRDPDAAQHVLDVLFALKRPELEERLYGFSNAIAELLAAPEQLPPEGEAGSPRPGQPKIGLITISKPIWFYGLEPLAAELLPPKEGRLRRIAFAQLALPGAYQDVAAAIAGPDDELGRLARAIPLWFAEAFHFSANYDPVATVGIITPQEGPTRFMIFASEWSTDNLRQLVETTQGGLDYIVTGALRVVASDYELTLRLHEVKTFRERKKFAARWAPGTADAELSRLHAEVRRFMEWSPASASFAYTPPAAPRSWLETLGASLGLFVVEKTIVGPDTLPPVPPDLAHAAGAAAGGECASLAFLTLRARARKLGFDAGADAPLARSTLVQQAAQLLG